MAFEAKITIDDELGPAVKKVLAQITGSQRKGMIARAARSSANALRKYHREYNNAGKWRKGGGGGSDFGQLIARGWGTPRITGSTATIVNASPYLSHKVTGGTIKAKRVKFLTIPLIKEARGRTAKEYRRTQRKMLFRPGNARILAEPAPGTAKGFKAVYALVKSVTQKPWKGAMPKRNVYANPFVTSILSQLKDALK